MSFVDLIVFIDATPWLRDSLNLGSVLLAGLLALTPLFGNRRRPRGKWWQSPWLFFLAIVISLFACRAPELFWPKVYNPDETQMLAQAITFESHPIPWLDVDGNTGGPIDSYAPLWSVPFGIQPNLITGRITALFCALGMMVFLYFTGRLIAGEISARLALLPILLFFCGTSLYDFVDYSSEQISLFLAGWAIYLLARLCRKPGSVYAIIKLGLVLGLLPMAKLQSVLMGTGLGLCAIWFIWRSSRPWWRAFPIRGLILAAATLTPTIIILSIVASFGAFNDFWISYIKAAQVYSYPDGYDFQRDQLNVLYYVMPLLAYLASNATVLIIIFVILQKLKMSRLTRDWWLLAIAVVMITFETICYPGRPFVHYIIYILPALGLMIIVNLRVLRTSLRAHASPRVFALLLQTAVLVLLFVDFFHFWFWPGLTIFGWNFEVSSFFLYFTPALSFAGLALAFVIATCIVAFASSKPPRYSWICRQRFAALAFFVAFFLIPLIPSIRSKNEYRGKIAEFVKTPPSKMAQAINKFRSPGARLAIWGWAPEYFVWCDIPMGTRDAVAALSINNWPYQKYYRERYLSDMRANRPELFLEAMGPLNFGFPDSKKYGIDIYPELKQLISEQYHFVEEIDGMRLFVRNDLAQSDAYIRPQN